MPITEVKSIVLNKRVARQIDVLFISHSSFANKIVNLYFNGDDLPKDIHVLGKVSCKEVNGGYGDYLLVQTWREPYFLAGFMPSLLINAPRIIVT